MRYSENQNARALHDSITQRELNAWIPLTENEKKNSCEN